jgi:hypothetical protein
MRRLYAVLPIAAIALVSAASNAQELPPVAEQLTAAVLPLPANMRDGAGVMGYKTAGKLELLRASKNGMICLADDPADDRFHAACYAETLEPFMARGRALRASGVTGARVDTVRFDEAKKGTLKMPTAPAALYSLTGPKGDFDAATGKTKSSKGLFVLYMPFATSESTGLSAQPNNGPWIMFPGTPKAHLMLSIGM